MKDPVANSYARSVGARLRAVRAQQGLSLHGVEEKSGGRWKAVLVGSYERGDRMATAEKLNALAEFYGVGLVWLLGQAPVVVERDAVRLVLDLEVLRETTPTAHWVSAVGTVVETVLAWRGDHGSRVLTLRRSDLSTLVMLTGLSRDVLVSELRLTGVLAAGARRDELVGPVKAARLGRTAGDR